MRQFASNSQRLDWADAVAALLLGVGLAIRTILTTPNIFFDARAGEATRVAIAFAQQGTLADAYFDGQGPTAHLMPVMPVIAGTIYRLLGVGSPAANAALFCWAVIQIATAYTLIYLVCRRLEFPKTSRALAAVLLALPVFTSFEIRGFRFWDGALCVAAVSWALLLMAAQRAALTKHQIVVLASIGALTTFINPIVGLALFGCIGVYCWGFGFGQAVRAAIVGGMLTGLLLVPWMARNQVQLEHPVVRSNFWLEVRMANGPEAASPDNPQRAYLNRLGELHPYKSPVAQQQVREIGEVAYNAKLKGETLDWIERNPGTFAALSVSHLRDFYLPPTWAYDFWEKAPIRKMAALVVPTLNFLGLIWLLAGAWAGRRLFRPMLAYVVIVGLPYALVQPLPRYTYVIYPLLAFLAADFIARSFAALAAFARRPARASGYIPQ